MKTHVLMVSRVYPATHKRSGEETYFIEKILKRNSTIRGYEIIKENINRCINWDILHHCNPKIHTIRANYPLWEKRIKEVQEGKSIISVRFWEGKPYNSKQVELCQLDKDSGIGVQKLDLIFGIDNPFVINENKISIETNQLAKNDGLTLDDFIEWFKNADFSKPMAIIHFTKFRY